MGVKDTANLALIPAAYKTSKVYSALPTDGDGDFTFTRTGSGTRINKAGLIETMGTNVPRLNYRLNADGNPSSCPELLLEPQRTNVLRYSEQFNQTNWSKQQSSVTADQTTAPDGTQSADKIQATGTSQARCEQSKTPTTNTSTFSAFVKAGNNRYIALAQFGATGAPNVIFNLETGGITTASSYATNKGIQAYPNGWYRVFMTYSHSSSDSFDITKIVLCNNPTNYAASTVGDFAYIWGAQKEVGSTLTSYIPTTTADVQRNIDSANKTSFTDLPNDYPITVLWKGTVDNYDSSGFTTQVPFSLVHSGNFNTYLSINFYSETQLTLRRRNTTDNSVFITYPTSLKSTHKIAIAFISSTTVKMYIDGVEILNSASLTSVPYSATDTIDSVLVGQLRDNADTGKRNSADELFIWNKTLTDAEMIEITSYTSFTEMATQQQYTIQ